MNNSFLVQQITDDFIENIKNNNLINEVKKLDEFSQLFEGGKVPTVENIKQVLFSEDMF